MFGIVLRSLSEYVDISREMSTCKTDTPVNKSGFQTRVSKEDLEETAIVF